MTKTIVLSAVTALAILMATTTVSQACGVDAPKEVVNPNDVTCKVQKKWVKGIGVIETQICKTNKEWAETPAKGCRKKLAIDIFGGR